MEGEGWMNTCLCDMSVCENWILAVLVCCCGYYEVASAHIKIS